MTTAEHVITAAMDVAKDIAEGRRSPADIEADAVEACRELFGVVHGPEDPLWDLHVDVTRQGIAAGAVSADELAEWLAVARTRAGVPVVEPEVSWIERALAEGADDEDEAEDGPMPAAEVLARAAAAVAAMDHQREPRCGHCGVVGGGHTRDCIVV